MEERAERPLQDRQKVEDSVKSGGNPGHWASGPSAEPHSAPQGRPERSEGARNRNMNGLAVFTGIQGPGAEAQAGKGKERGQEDAGPRYWRPPNQRPQSRGRDGVQARRLGGSRRTG